jgi:integrase
VARTIKEYRLSSREARGKLKVQGYCYWREVERGVHVGYRRLKGKAGTWWARFYQGDRTYVVEPLGIADDQSDADGVKVLSWSQVVKAARKLMVERAYRAAGKHVGPYTVAQAMQDYLDWRVGQGGKSTRDSEYRTGALILPTLGTIEVAALTTKQIRDWHVSLARQAPRLRTAPGKKQQNRERQGDADDWRRRRRATANRTLTILKAALNHAWREGKAVTNLAWARVEPFREVEAARVRYLSVAEANRLTNACDAEFRPLVQAALQTGARYGELIRLTVGDYNADAGTLNIRQSKSGKPRYVVLTDEGQQLFRQLCAGRAGMAIMLTKPNGQPWQKSHQARPMMEACEHGRITPPVSFHVLRHTWASHAVMAGMPLMVVARNLGHADTRMVERHYGHLAPSYVADAVRQHAPRFGFRPDAKVAVLRGDGSGTRGKTLP